MKYLGGKARYGGEISQIIKSKRVYNQTIREPFCGAGWVSQYFYPGPVICSDISLPLILLHQAMQHGWIPPDFISEEEYNNLHQQWKNGKNNPLIGFVGFACSWGGKWFAGYARDNGTRNYCLESKRSLLAKHKKLRHVIFEHKNFRTIFPVNEVIYCDPPYKDTTGYRGQKFDHLTFWRIMGKWSQNNIVIVSEYNAPSDWKIIWQVSHFAIKSMNSKLTTEKLFELEG